MPKGIPSKKYTGEFKQKVVETMQQEGLSYREAAREFDISNHHVVANWERIYLEEGPEGLYIERRGRASAANGTKKGRPSKLDKEVEEDLIAAVNNSSGHFRPNSQSMPKVYDALKKLYDKNPNLFHKGFKWR